MSEEFLNGGIDNRPRCLAITDVGEQCRNPAVTKVRSGRRNYAVCRMHEHIKKESKSTLRFVAL